MSAIAATASPSLAAATSMCRIRWAARRSRSRAVPGHHPDRRRLLKVETASAERIAPFCPHFGVCGGCAIQHWDAERLSRLEARARGRRRWRRPESIARSRRWSMPMARAAAASPCTRGWARTTCSRSALPRPVRTTSSRSTAARSSIPHLDGAIEAAWAHRRAADLDRQAARHPGHRDRQRARCRRARLRPAVDRP